MDKFAPGDPIPFFPARTGRSATFALHTMAGRYLVLCFFGSAGLPDSRAALDLVCGQHRALFRDDRACFFGISTDPEDETLGRVRDMTPSIWFIFDNDRRISTIFGAEDKRFSVVLDPNLRVLATIPFDDADSHVTALTDMLAALPEPDAHASTTMHAPVLIVPRVLEPAMCRTLIDCFEADGGTDSGFMRQIDGKTVGMIDHNFKRRSDLYIEDPDLRAKIRDRISGRINPEMHKAFHFSATRLERYLIACYDAASGGFFRPHRDNTTTGTAHRRFAVSINLNAEEYTGGDVRFPEYGSRSYRAPTGGAVVFSCSLLHEALPVTSGRRYALLPFLFDEAGETIRRRNQHMIDTSRMEHRSRPETANSAAS